MAVMDFLRWRFSSPFKSLATSSEKANPTRFRQVLKSFHTRAFLPLIACVPGVSIKITAGSSLPSAIKTAASKL